MLRCFDYCPTDPAEDSIIKLLAGSVVMFGAAVAVACGFLGTRWSTKAAAIILVLGSLIGVAGATSLLLVPSIEMRGDRLGAAIFASIGLATGVATAAAAQRLRRRAKA